jgi:hypothetical protein
VRHDRQIIIRSPYTILERTDRRLPWQASGQSQQAFCKANDLNYPCFGYWLRKFRDQGAVAGAPNRPSGFVPVEVSLTGRQLSLHLPNGIELRGVTVQNLALVEQLLARL